MLALALALAPGVAIALYIYLKDKHEREPLSLLLISFLYGVLSTAVTLFISLIFGLLNSICFTESLKQLPLNIASAVFFSITIIGLCLVSYFWFHETTNWKQFLGIFIILIGVVLVNYN